MAGLIDQHPVFGPDRMRYARKAYYAYKSAQRAYGAHGWHDDSYQSRRLKERLSEARTVREMYSEYGDSVLG